MERVDIPLVELEELGPLKVVYESYPLTTELNDYLDMKGASPLPVVTGNTLEDIVHFTYSVRPNPQWGNLWNYVSKYFDPNSRDCDDEATINALIDELNGYSNVLSNLVGDVMKHTYKRRGLYPMLSFIQLLQNDDERLQLTVREAFANLGLSTAYIYVDRDRDMMEEEAEHACRDPNRFKLLVNTNTNVKLDQRLIYMNVVTELVCLTLTKSFSLSLSFTDFQARFGELYAAYLQTRHRDWFRKIGSRSNIDYSHYVCVLVSDVYQCFVNGHTPEYYEDYRKAVMFACEALDVDLFEVLLKHPNWEKFLREFFFV